MKIIALLIAVAIALSACKEQSTEAVKSSETVQASATQSAEQIASLNLDWDTFRKRVDEDFEAAGFDFAKIPDSLKPEGDAEAARLTATLPINDDLIGIVATDPATGQLTSITVTVSINDDADDNLNNFSSASLMLSAAAGDDGNEKVGGQIIEMIGDTVSEFSKQVKKDSSTSTNKNFVEDSFIEDGVKYGIIISDFMPVMMFAEPADNQ